MEILILIVGVIAVVMGVLLITAPQLLTKINLALNTVITTDENIFSKRIPIGIVFILVAIYLIYIVIKI